MSEDRREDAPNEIGEDVAEQSLDEIFSLLSNRYVRYTLLSLSDEPTTTFEQLTDAVVGMEAAERDAIASPTDRERIRIRLYHVTLPKLEAADYVDFDTEEETVRRTRAPPAVDSLLGFDE